MRRSLALVLALAALAVVPGAAEEEGHPRFPNLTLATLDGDTVELDAFLGRPVLLTFWASWCGPCRVELPELEKLYGELAGTGFVVLTINVDAVPAAARRFMAATDVDLPVYRLPPAVLEQIGIDSLPTNVLIRPDGHAEFVARGYSPQLPEQIRERVRTMADDRAE